MYVCTPYTHPACVDTHAYAYIIPSALTCMHRWRLGETILQWQDWCSSLFLPFYKFSVFRDLLLLECITFRKNWQIKPHKTSFKSNIHVEIFFLQRSRSNATEEEAQGSPSELPTVGEIGPGFSSLLSSDRVLRNRMCLKVFRKNGKTQHFMEVKLSQAKLV